MQVQWHSTMMYSIPYTRIIDNLYIQYYPKPVVYSLLFSDVIALRDPGLENKRSRPLAVKQPVLLARQS